MRLSRHCLGQQSFTRSGRPHQQCSLGKPGSDFGILSRVMQEIHNLNQRFLCLIFTCHILKRNPCFLLYIHFRIALPHTHGAAASAHLLEHHSQEYPHERHRQYHIQQNIQNSPGIIAQHTTSIHPPLFQSCGESIQVFHNDRGIGYLEISIEGITRHPVRPSTGTIVLQGKQHLTAALHFHCIHPVQIQIFQEFHITDFLGIAIAAKKQIPKHKNKQHRA